MTSGHQRMTADSHSIAGQDVEPDTRRSMKVILAIAALADLALVVLLIGISGFIFGGGPEGMKGETGAAIVWMVALIASLAAPILGFMLLRRKRPGLGVLVAWAPPVGGAIFFSLPIHPY